MLSPKGTLATITAIMELTLMACVFHPKSNIKRMAEGTASGMGARQIYLRREKEIIGPDSKTGCREGSVVIDVIETIGVCGTYAVSKQI